MNSISSLPTDTIPPDVKQYFFSDVQKPDLLRDYDVLGFDADHCLVKYNVRDTVKLLVRSELQELVDHAAYPEDILRIDLDDETTLDMCMNGAVFDVDHGLVLKLVEGKEVVRAMKGFRVLTQDEIVAVYGNPPVFHNYQWPNTTHLSSPKGAYWAFLTFFDTPKVALVLSAVESMEKGLVTTKSYFDICEDIKQVVFANYIHFNEKEVKPIGTYGRFFPEVVKNPLKYIQAQPSLRESLLRLKRAGKKLFLATNSHTEYSNLIMSTTLGDDWRSLFDIICCHCRKPLFFWDQKIDSFYELDQTKSNLKGKAITDPSSLKEGMIYTQGNVKTLHGFFQTTLGKQDIKVAFFGDQYITDVYSSSIHDNWDGIAVVEEMNFYDERYCEEVDPRLMTYRKFWGDSYFVDTTVSGQVKRSYFLSQVEDCARYMLPLMKNINILMSSEQVQDNELRA